MRPAVAMAAMGRSTVWKAAVCILTGLLLCGQPAQAKDDEEDEGKLQVRLTAPANGALFNAPATVALAASASTNKKNLAIEKVEFFQGTTLIGTASAAPYGLNWSGVAPGTYTLRAKATAVKAKGGKSDDDDEDKKKSKDRETEKKGKDKDDKDDNLSAFSNPVSITVNARPLVSLSSPASGASYLAPATVSLAASASDPDGTVAKVDFYQGTNVIGTATAAPYSFAWQNVAAGTYALTAVATDNRGASTTSGSVSITVNAPPTVALTSPANNAGYTAPAAITLAANAADADGTIAKVEFYQGTTLIGTATTAPYSFAWQNVVAGSYSLTAVATDDRGAATTSSPVSVRVNAAPTVAITAPANNAVYQAPANITLSAQASDADGSIARVDFYQGTSLIGGASAAPFSINWTSVAAGTYSLTAVATDNLGASTTSAPVTVSVNALPTVTLTGPANNASYTAPASITLTASAQDSDGIITKVEFLQGATVLATVTVAPYTFAWTNVAQGTYVLSARATDNNGGSATSASVSIVVNAGVAQIYYIHPDHLNTPRLIADSTGATVWKWDQQEPFGNDVPNSDPNSTGTTFDFPLRFPGQYADKETGLAYNMARDYSSEIGRYFQSDPIGLDGGINTYLYAAGNPVDSIDPLGLQQAIITSISARTTTFYYLDEFDLPNGLQIETRVSCARGSLPGACDQFSTPNIQLYDPKRRSQTEYGPPGTLINVGDSRVRHIHGGGTCAGDDATEPRQGWCKTFGCTRGQNEDVQRLRDGIFRYRDSALPIPYYRVN